MTSISLVLPPVQVVPIVLILEVIASLRLIPQVWRDIEWFSLRWLLIGALFATPFGVYLLATTPVGPLRISISLLVLVAAFLQIRGWAWKRMPKISLTLAGLLRSIVFIIGGVLLNALFIFLLPLGASVLACVLFIGLTMGGWPGAIMALPNQILSSQGRSTGFGVFYMVFYGIMAALTPVAGWLRDFTGKATASLLFGGALMILTLAALTSFRILQRRWPADTHKLCKAPKKL